MRYPDCYPFIKNDPFILSETPHVYFVGNQPEFATELLKGVFADFSLSPSINTPR